MTEVTATPSENTRLQRIGGVLREDNERLGVEPDDHRQRHEKRQADHVRFNWCFISAATSRSPSPAAALSVMFVVMFLKMFGRVMLEFFGARLVSQRGSAPHVIAAGKLWRRHLGFEGLQIDALHPTERRRSGEGGHCAGEKELT